MADPENTTDAQSWSAYWTGAESANQSLAGGAKGEALDRFWAAFFAERLNEKPRLMIDLACGAGAVSIRAAEMADSAGVSLDIHCTDYAPAAVRSLCKTVDAAAGFVADASALPLPAGVYDIAASQFGLEYAGPEAFGEAARILAPGGVFAAVIHLKGGGIEAECAANLEVAVKAQQIGLLAQARDVFETGFSVLSGQAPREKFSEADKAFRPTVKAAKSLLDESPPSMARAFFERLCADLAHMYQRINAYAPDDIRAWLSRGEFELKAYEHRMISMIKAAQSREDMAGLADRLRAAGLTTAPPGVLELGDPLKPAAWTLVAHRPASGGG